MLCSGVLRFPVWGGNSGDSSSASAVTATCFSKAIKYKRARMCPWIWEENGIFLVTEPDISVINAATLIVDLCFSAWATDAQAL